MYVPTALFIAVVPTVIVAITVPQAANTVTVLALKLVLFTLPGSYTDEEEEMFQTTNKEYITKAKTRYSIAIG